MNTTREHIKKLYEDALYYHFLRKGFTDTQAEVETKKIFSD